MPGALLEICFGKQISSIKSGCFFLSVSKLILRPANRHMLPNRCPELSLPQAACIKADDISSWGDFGGKGGWKRLHVGKRLEIDAIRLAKMIHCPRGSLPQGRGFLTSHWMHPAVRNWNMPLLDASFRALVPLHQNRSRHVNCIQAHKAWMQADPQREFIRILVSVGGVQHAGSDFD